ncbi:MAG: dihydropteroate synthase [Candidatus Thermoplasmatota archaeon]|jgi:dihydropteroate synthase|nr:dihydropteroate synthase [Candidatus Thermoplasmatota archaeon]
MRFLKIGKKIFDLDERTIVMGILNVTPDSFSNGGKYFSTELAVNHAIEMEKDGADIIDIGGESTRPGAMSVSLEEEKNRVIPVVEQLVDKLHIPISVDTYKSEVAKKVLDLGVGMINDISALRGDKKLANVVAKYDVPICLMHMKGNPRDMQVDPVYDDVVKEIYSFLKERSDYAIFNDIKKDKIIIDPGIGFGKRTGRGIEDNCEILRRLSEFKKLGYPIMVGASRKTFIGNVCGGQTPLPVTERLEGSLAAACISVMNGADMVRVHDVKETRRCLCLVDRVVKKH